VSAWTKGESLFVLIFCEFIASHKCGKNSGIQARENSLRSTDDVEDKTSFLVAYIMLM